MATEKRLIDANDALNRLQKAEKEMMVVSVLGCKAVPMDGVIEFIQTRPTVDAVEVVHGHWIAIRDKKFGGSLGLQCSVCRSRTRNKGGNYCPNCGAKMDGDMN